MKSLGDAIALRNRLIAHLEQADTDCARDEREPLLTFVVAGGGFAGVLGKFELVIFRDSERER